MKLTPMKYARIEGTEVLVQVSTPDEGKAALRELKHKKKEYALIKKALQRQAKAARTSHDKHERKKAKNGKLFRSFARVTSLISGNDPLRDLAETEGELARTEEILHNLESCILQIEGKLLRHK